MIKFYINIHNKDKFFIMTNTNYMFFDIANGYYNKLNTKFMNAVRNNDIESLISLIEYRIPYLNNPIMNYDTRFSISKSYNGEITLYTIDDTFLTSDINFFREYVALYNL